MFSTQEIEDHPVKFSLVILSLGYCLGLFGLFGPNPWKDAFIVAHNATIVSALFITISVWEFGPFTLDVAESFRNGIGRLAVPCLITLAIEDVVFWPVLRNVPSYNFVWWSTPAAFLLTVVMIVGLENFFSWDAVRRQKHMSDRDVTIR